jgi:hypothetical protein
VHFFSIVDGSFGFNFNGLILFLFLNSLDEADVWNLRLAYQSVERTLKGSEVVCCFVLF